MIRIDFKKLLSFEVSLDEAKKESLICSKSCFTFISSDFLEVLANEKTVLGIDGKQSNLVVKENIKTAKRQSVNLSNQIICLRVAESSGVFIAAPESCELKMFNLKSMRLIRTFPSFIKLGFENIHLISSNYLIVTTVNLGNSSRLVDLRTRDVIVLGVKHFGNHYKNDMDIHHSSFYPVSDSESHQKGNSFHIIFGNIHDDEIYRAKLNILQ